MNTCTCIQPCHKCIHMYLHSLQCTVSYDHKVRLLPGPLLHPFPRSACPHAAYLAGCQVCRQVGHHPQAVCAAILRTTTAWEHRMSARSCWPLSCRQGHRRWSRRHSRNLAQSVGRWQSLSMLRRAGKLFMRCSKATHVAGLSTVLGAVATVLACRHPCQRMKHLLRSVAGNILPLTRICLTHAIATTAAGATVLRTALVCL